MLHKAERRTATTKAVREAEQEKRRREEALAQAIGIRTLTTPSQAAKPRPLRNAATLPIVATIAVAITGPTPSMVTARRHASFSVTAPPPPQILQRRT